MQEIIVDKNFKYLLPALSEMALSDLEEDILENGIRDPLVLWDGMLIDGYNRYSIAMKHNLSFSTVSMEFNSRDEVVVWIIKNQVARRNLTPFQLRYFRGMHYQADRRSQGYNFANAQNASNCQNGSLMPDTAKQLADKYNVSPRTIMRDSQLTDALVAIGEVSPEAKQSILSGETRMTRKLLTEMMGCSQETIDEIAASIENGTFESSQAAANAAELPTLESAFSRISGVINRELKGLTKTYTPSEVKNALRLHIAELEDIYKQM